jgi:hypothetical protein
MVSDATVAKVSGRGKDVPSKLRIRCGRCRRIHQDVTEANYLRYPQSRRPCKVSRAAEMRPGEGLTIQLPAGMRMLETTPKPVAGCATSATRSAARPTRSASPTTPAPWRRPSTRDVGKSCLASTWGRPASRLGPLPPGRHRGTGPSRGIVLLGLDY